ncbi:hypothetical protein [Aliiglaciecola litoralis]|uniref:HPt domain-containing protein n=1 Tax=Aliiglaciecola litoralis TaxID=582857 RepID=A0ABN1LR97_9ALTE
MKEKNDKSMFDKLVGDIEQNRDELKLQAHLFKKETKDEWEALEKKWHHFKGSARHASIEAQAASKDVFAATQLLGEELKASYKRIVKSL